MLWVVEEAVEDADVPNTWHCNGWIELGGKRATASVTYTRGEPPLMVEASDKMEILMMSRLLELALGMYDKAYPDTAWIQEAFIKEGLD